jgi:hypothetical protein
MNGYNGYPITQKAWRAVIQPKANIIMAMELDCKAVKKGRCADIFLNMSKITNIRNKISSKHRTRYRPIVGYEAFYYAAEIDAEIIKWTPAWPPGDLRDAVSILYGQMMWIYLWRTIYPPQITNWKLDSKITTTVRDSVKLLSEFEPRDPNQTLLLAPAFVIG